MLMQWFETLTEDAQCNFVLGVPVFSYIFGVLSFAFLAVSYVKLWAKNPRPHIKIRLILLAGLVTMSLSGAGIIVPFALIILHAVNR